jgi:outer membrane protein TolC
LPRRARSYYQVRWRAEQIEAARQQVRAAVEAVPLNFEAIVGGELRAIEGLQAVQGLPAARAQYLSAVLDYNRAQLQLVRALGQPPEWPVEEGVAADSGPKPEL